MVVIRPLTMPKLSASTLAIGATQLVVHEAFEITWCCPGSYLSSLTPITIVMSSPLAGAEMITFRAPALRCAAAASREVNLPVDSMTTSTPRSPQGSAAGSFSAMIRISESPARMMLPSAVTSTSSLPSTVSYLSRCALVAGSVRSLAATISMPLPCPLACAAWTARQKFRPIRPNPLMPTRIVTAFFSSLLCGPRAVHRAYRTGRHRADRSPAADHSRARSGQQHVRGQLGFGARDAQVTGALVGHREQAADTAGDGVLGQLRVGKLAEFLQAGLAVLDAQQAGHGQVLRRVAAEDLQRPLHPGPGCDGGAGAAPQVCVIEVGQPVRRRPDLAPHPALLPGEHTVVRTEPGQQRADRVPVPDHDPVHPAHLAGLGVDLQPPGGPGQCQRRLRAGAGHLERHRPARAGEAAVRQEGPAPGRLAVAGRAGHHVPGQPADRPPVAVYQPGLARQAVPVLAHPHHIPVALAQAARRDHDQVAVVPEHPGDVLAQPAGGGTGVQLSLDDDAAAGDVQAAGKAQQGGHLRLAAARLEDLNPA